MSEPNIIRVIQKKPGMVNKPEVMDIEDTLEANQALVSPRGEPAVIERVYAPEFEEQRVEVFCNEEALFDSACTHNVQIGGNMLQGPIYFTTYDEEGDSLDLTDEQVEFVLAKLKTVVQSVF